MPRPAKPSSKTQAKGPGSRPAPKPTFMAVRMLSGPKAGQVVRVTREQAAQLCSGWTPQAELVARNVAQGRETR